jgi:hypothetical protein
MMKKYPKRVYSKPEFTALPPVSFATFLNVLRELMLESSYSQEPSLHLFLAVSQSRGTINILELL